MNAQDPQSQGQEPVTHYIARYYDGQAKREWQRMERHRTEFAITLRGEQSTKVL